MSRKTTTTVIMWGLIAWLNGGLLATGIILTCLMPQSAWPAAIVGGGFGTLACGLAALVAIEGDG